MIIARYDQRRGCIEGYQLLANNTDEGHIPWQPDGFDSDIQVSAFAPEVRLHLDNPVLRLPANTQDEEDDEEPVVMHLEHRQTSDGTANGNGSILNTPQAQASRPRRQRRFQTEIHMRQGSPGHLRSSFFHARCLTPEEFAERSASEFPYGSVWPPPSIPSRHRVMGAGLHRPYFLQPHDSALSPLDVHDCAFRIMKWLQMRELWFDPRTHPGIFPGIFNLNDLPSSSSQAAPDNNRPMMLPVLRTTTVGDEIATYATLDPDLYTPTPSAPFRGIWVGDYGPHGCEFVWIDQYQDQDPAAPPPDRDSMTRFEGESEEAFAARKREAAIYRGSLMAVKLTGDPNVPRGEITFHAADLGEHGFVRVEKEPPFAGVRVVRSNGHVAHEGFANDAYIDGELLLISPDRLAHHWIDMERVNYFHRVDIDRFLVPE
ncbi:hypothetical protein N658DRAFT_558082 [Parathielavia hyrcaniae]|uniref:Uncharacterized protein n=1 Tax=Parathielavia hyrcaniae TaxID=113614 RepID=A0AAN6Q7Y8_9PEZI|nr:hypothetical protein N658DRAFT_558082 [Parathielavia hyrcaniae]